LGAVDDEVPERQADINVARAERHADRHRFVERFEGSPREPNLALAFTERATSVCMHGIRVTREFADKVFESRAYHRLNTGWKLTRERNGRIGQTWCGFAASGQWLVVSGQ
jgi:hypothetical protein